MDCPFLLSWLSPKTKANRQKGPKAPGQFPSWPQSLSGCAGFPEAGQNFGHGGSQEWAGANSEEGPGPPEVWWGTAAVGSRTFQAAGALTLPGSGQTKAQPLGQKVSGAGGARLCPACPAALPEQLLADAAPQLCPPRCLAPATAPGSWLRLSPATSVHVGSTAPSPSLWVVAGGQSPTSPSATTSSPFACAWRLGSGNPEEVCPTSHATSQGPHRPPTAPILRAHPCPAPAHTQATPRCALPVPISPILSLGRTAQLKMS